MKVVPLEGDKWRVFLNVGEYRTLLESAYEPTQRAGTTQQVRLEMRLMACSLRVDTASTVRYGDFKKIETPEGDKWLLGVEAKDATEREAETKPRGVYIPDDLMADIHTYAKRRNIDPDDPLFAISTRTVQRDVKRSAKNAATRTGIDDFRKVSAHDLRRYFATHLLYRHQVDPPVVRSLGGWMSDEAMFEYLVLPNDVLFERLRDANLLGTTYDKHDRHDRVEKVQALIGRLEELLADGDATVVQTAASEVERVFEDDLGVNLDDATTHDRIDDERRQTSLQQLAEDESGTSRGLLTRITEVVSHLQTDTQGAVL